jgi:HMG (high mobility group) box
VREKSEYKGPWVVPKRRAKKHPLAPKRPMSAFLKFSQKRRSVVKERNPDMSNTDVSRLLGEMWRNASAAERAPYVEQEERERAAYKAEIQKWREEQAKLDASTRTSHLDVMDVADEMQASVPVQQQQHPAPRDMYSDSANSFASYEPISLHGADEAAPFVRSSLAPREVFRSYSSGGSSQHHSHRAHASQPRPVDEQRPRSADAANMYSYRFGGLYSHHEQEMYYPPPRNYRGTLKPTTAEISSAVLNLYSPFLGSTKCRSLNRKCGSGRGRGGRGNPRKTSPAWFFPPGGPSPQ